MRSFQTRTDVRPEQGGTSVMMLHHILVQTELNESKKDRCRDRLKCGRTRLLEQFRGIQIVDQVMKETVRFYYYSYKIIIEILGIRKWDFICTRGRLVDGTV